MTRADVAAVLAAGFLLWMVRRDHIGRAGLLAASAVFALGALNRSRAARRAVALSETV